MLTLCITMFLMPCAYFNDAAASEIYTLSRPGALPILELLEKLGADLRIGSGEIAAILKKHGVEADVERLQDSYRKRLGQRLMASIRDEEGRREVLARGSEYIVVECCSDQQALKAIRHRIHSQMNGLDDSAGKVRRRIRVLDRLVGNLMLGRRKES